MCLGGFGCCLFPAITYLAFKIKWCLLCWSIIILLAWSDVLMASSKVILLNSPGASVYVLNKEKNTYLHTSLSLSTVCNFSRNVLKAQSFTLLCLVVMPPSNSLESSWNMWADAFIIQLSFIASLCKPDSVKTGHSPSCIKCFCKVNNCRFHCYVDDEKLHQSRDSGMVLSTSRQHCINQHDALSPHRLYCSRQIDKCITPQWIKYIKHACRCIWYSNNTIPRDNAVIR